jgi:hypothetical protein
MGKWQGHGGGRKEELLAEVAAAACNVASRTGFKGALIDIELDLWYAGQVLLGGSPGGPPGHQGGGTSFREVGT